MGFCSTENILISTVFRFFLEMDMVWRVQWKQLSLFE